MNVIINPKKLKGSLAVPPSKSQAHRLILAASLSKGESRIENLSFSQDIVATLRCVEKLGMTWAKTGPDSVEVSGIRRGDPGSHCEFFCGESGSTLRFIIPISLVLAGGGTFTGKGRLMERPQEPYQDLFEGMGVRWEQDGKSLAVNGALAPGCYMLPGNVSSQFITGLMYALPLMGEESRIMLTSPLESSGYIDMTIDVLKRFGVDIFPVKQGWVIPGGQSYVNNDTRVEGDYSQAGFFCAANGLGSKIALSGLAPDSVQGDRIILEYSRRLEGADDVELDVSQCPDLVPALAVYAALRDGRHTAITNAARLRIKESDRLETVTHELTSLGAKIVQGADRLDITGVSALKGGVTDAHNDHRIAMMLAVAATRADGPVIVRGAECVAKSYPDFWEDYVALGGDIRQCD